MSKVIGTRVNDEVYNKLKQQDKSITEILRGAIDKYLSKPDDKSEINVNTCKQPVNSKKNEGKYQETRAEVDAFLSCLEAE